MKEQRKGFNKFYEYSDFVKYNNNCNSKSKRKLERLFARIKRRKLNREVLKEEV